jgi:hypothetical protein
MKARFAIHFSQLLLTFGIVRVALCIGSSVMAASPPGDVVGKVTVGYQGWFACTGDGAPINSWWHWSGTTQPPTPTTLTNKVHCWPDMRQFTKGYQTAFANFGNGQPALLFSSYDDQVVQTHFRWMAENGIDTAALQRFNPNGGEGATRNAMAVKVKNAAETNHVKFYIMYDISGWSSFTNQIKTDWTNVIIGQLHITNSPMYAMQNGKPVVCIWGMGFNDSNHPSNAAPCLDVINWFKDQGCYVIGGVPREWRTGVGGSRAGFLGVYHAFNMLSPWMVGGVGNISGADNIYNNVTVPDQADCNANGVDYQPCVLPGDTGQRVHGNFMWRQFYNMKRAGCQGIYISMFDEFNEGNQIACTAEDVSMIPVGSSSLYFTLDQDGTHCSSDYYLRLTGDGGKMLKGQIALTSTRPTLPVLPPTIPPAPSNVIATAGNSQVSLTWAASAQAASYNVWRATVSGGPYTIVTTNVGMLSYTDTGLVNGTSYYYVISAVNSLGESTNSAQVSVTPILIGLRGDYYNNVDFTAFVLTRTDLGVNFDWGTGSPDPSIGVDTFSVRWTGQIQSLFSQTYTFYTTSDDGVRLWVNGVQLVNNWTGHSPTENSGTIALTGGAPYSIQMDYYEDGGGAVAKLSWSSPSQPKEIIPAIRLFPPNTLPAVPAGLAATAISSSQINLSWATSALATGYNVKRAIVSGGPYTVIATDLAGLAYTNTGLANGTIYYFVVSATNSFGESANSVEASAQTVSTTPPQLNFKIAGGLMQFNWPSDHIGWRLEAQTNSIGAGLGTNWVTISGSPATNHLFIPINTLNGSVFFRLIYQ